jgi:cyclophilin family peptidyl-prolyl cis-trans isomerase/protein-disulfide isomerase
MDVKMKNYYQLLDLEPNATSKQIEKQYKQLLRTWNTENLPGAEEKRQAEEKIAEINEAYAVLSDPVRREAYDQTLGTGKEQDAPTAEDVSTEATGSISKPGRSTVIIVVLSVALLALLAYILVSKRLLPAKTDAGLETTAVASTLPTATAEVLATSSTENAATPSATTVPTVAFTASDPATCKVVPILPEVSATTEALYPSVRDTDWTLGPKDASIVIYEYSDFQCPYCAKAAPSLKELQAAYPHDVLVVFRHFPLSSIHPNAKLAAQAAEAAGLQSKFWQMHDLLFEKQSEWSGLSTDDFKTWLKNAAKSINLNSNQFMVDLESQQVIEKVTTAEADALAAGLNSTPTLLFNKIRYQGRSDVESLTSIVKYFLLPQKSYTDCPEMTIDPNKIYTATIKTEKGDIVLELYPKQAPWAVNSFVFLARNKWFDGSAFFRVIPGFVAQTGDPSNSSFGGPGYEFTSEVTPELRFDKAGVLGMANSGNNDNGSQFFITYTALPDLDGKYTIFGQVIEGMDVLSALRPRNPASDQILITPDAIISITIEEK